MSWILALLLSFAPPSAGSEDAEPALASDSEGAAEGELGGTGEAPTSGTSPEEIDAGGTDTGESGDEDTAGEDTGLAQIPAPAPAVPDPGLAPAPALKQAPKVPANDPDAPITVTTRLTPDPAHIGDLLTLEVIVAFPRDHSVHLPNGLDLSPLELVASERGAIEPTGEGLRQRFTITLQYFDVGEAWVPSFPITWVDPEEAVHSYHVAPHHFEVESVMANEADPQRQGEDPPISLEYPNRRAAIALVSVLGGLLLAGAIAALVLVFVRRKKPAVIIPRVPAHVRALADLDALEAEREAMIEAGAHQDYYLRLTEIAKAYLGTRFGFEAPDRTTEEIAALLAEGSVQLAPLDPDELLAFLRDCDLVKFARLSPPSEETLEALAFVRELVMRSRTRPVDATPAGELDEAAEAEVRGVQDPDQPRATRPKPPKPPKQASASPEQREEDPP